MLNVIWFCRTGVIKWIGYLKEFALNPSVYVGVRLDEPGSWRINKRVCKEGRSVQWELRQGISKFEITDNFVYNNYFITIIYSKLIFSFLIIMMLVGEHDGLYQNKRFFRCTPHHGTVLLKEDILFFKSRLDLNYRSIPLLWIFFI